MAIRGRTCQLTPLARADLENIWNYTADTWSPEQADKYISEFVTAFAAIAAGERKGRLIPERAGYLKYAVGSHLVFYREGEATIDVVRVLHQRMDVERHL
jgi:toxin ParE1/3/4